ncbi:hypothetical protein GCM10028824_43030 [Hymenobacter segetis]
MGWRKYWAGYLLTQLPLFVLATYPLLYGLLPWLLQRRQPGRFLLGLAAWVASTALISNILWLSYGAFWAPRLFGWPAFLTLDWPSLVGDLNAGFFMLLVAAGGASAIKVFNEWYEQRQLGEELRQRQLRTELELLKTQLQPAFLFDALRSLQLLTAQQPAAAPAAVLHLAAVLRYMLYESPQDAVPLADEVQMVRHYVALEQLRLGTRVDVSLNFSGALDAHAIAPLLLLPFLENGFRHATGPELECPWVSIDLVAKQTSVTFKVINSHAPTAPAWHDGPDLRRVRERLARLYPGRHELKVVSEPDTFLIALRLWLAPLSAAQPTAPPVPTARPAAPAPKPATHHHP